jgi:hypothetical protein
MRASFLAHLPPSWPKGSLAVPGVPAHRPMDDDAMTTLQRRPCPRCQRVVAWRVILGPRVNRGRPIPALSQPVPHKRIVGANLVAKWEWCVPTKAPRP